MFLARPGMPLRLCKSLKIGWRCVDFYVWCLVGTYSDRVQESPTLNLANDCSRFVTGYFDIISTSSPHIYHSALALAPKNSTVRQLYQLHVHPFTRVVHGGQASWDANIAAIIRSSEIHLAVWSPCNGFIAIACEGAETVDVLDSATLQRLQTLELPPRLSTMGKILAFSPDGRVLTYSSCDPNFDKSKLASVISWELQTGGVIGVVQEAQISDRFLPPSIAHSENGKIVGISRSYRADGGPEPDSVEISIFDVASSIFLGSHLLYRHSSLSDGIWFQRNSLRFATADRMAITIWEVGFSSSATPTKIETFPLPSSHGDALGLRLLRLPCRLALAFEEKVQIWDVLNSKYLLQFTGASHLQNPSFSSDGRFFACRTAESGLYLWRESPTGYILHKILSSTTVSSSPLFSPDGESVVAFGGRTIQLWHTRGSTLPPSDVPTQAPQRTDNFVLDFSPDGTLAAVARQRNDTIAILDLKSGVLKSTTNVGMDVYGLGVIGNTIVAIGDEKVTRWVLPATDCSRADLEDRLWTTTLNTLGPEVCHGSISPNSEHIVIVVRYSGTFLSIHSANTGDRLSLVPERARVGSWEASWFAPGGGYLWCADQRGVAVEWKVVGEQRFLEFSRTGVGLELEHTPAGYPWASSRGYRVTKDWWIRGPDGKRLLMLPPHWRSDGVLRVWKGQFLALLHCELSEPVILELLNP